MKKIAKMLALSLTATLVVGCGQSATDEGNQTSSGTTGVKDTLVVAQGADPTSLDPEGANEQPGARVKKQIYDTLFAFDDDMNVVPALAESYTFEDDNTTLVLKLREGVTFHNGEQFTSEDVLFTLQRSAASANIGHIVSAIDPERIEIIDDYQIKIGLKDPFAPILAHLAHSAIGIVDKTTVESMGAEAFAINPVGTGPYQFVEWKADDYISLVRFDEYWGETAKTENVVIRTIVENSTRALEVEQGGVDIAYDIAPSDIERVEGNEDLNLVRSLNFSSSYIGFNVEKEPFNDPKVRQAINYALDMESIVEAVYYGAGAPSAGPLTEGVWASNTDLEPYPYDVEKAKALLAEAGYPDGFDTTIWTNDNAQRIEITEITQNMLSEIGINATVETVEWATYLEATANGEHDMFILGWVCVTGDPDYGLYAPFHSSQFGAAGNRSFYANDRVDELLDLGRTSVDPAEREAAYLEAQQIIRDEAPWVFIQQGEDLNAIRSNVKGFVNSPTGHHALDTVYFE